MPRRSLLDLRWPVAGVDRSVAYQTQPPYTTPDALNVRTDDTREFRERGGSRPGLGLAMRTQLPGPVRMLSKVSILRSTEAFRYTPVRGTQLDTNLLVPAWGNAPTYVPGSSYQGNAAYLAGTNNQDWAGYSNDQPAADTTKPYELSLHIRGKPGLTMEGTAQIHFGLSAGDADPTTNGLTAYVSYLGGEYSVGLTKWTAGVPQNWSSPTQTDNPNAPGVLSVRVDESTNAVEVFFRDTSFHTQTLTTYGHYAAVAAQGQPNSGTPNGSILIDHFSREWFETDATYEIDQDQRRDLLVAVSDSELWVEDTANSMRQVSTSLTLTDEVQLCGVDREQKLYIADFGRSLSGTATVPTPYTVLTDLTADFVNQGVTTEYNVVITASDFAVNERQIVTVYNADGGTFTLTFNGATTAPIAWNANFATVTAALTNLSTIDTVTVTEPASGGPWTIEFTGSHAGTDVELLVADHSGLTQSGAGTPSMTVDTLNQGQGGGAVIGSYEITNVTATTITFTPSLPVGSYSSSVTITYELGRPPKVYDAVDDTLSLHTADTSKGSVPVGCRLIALYRDRICYAASDSLPHVWYMSRQGDPNDWDYSQEDAGAAVFAQASVAGQLADPITALIAHGDECLIIGCYTSLWILRGDPGYGGIVDQLSRKIGIVGAKAWCRTPDDMCVFLSPDGLYVMPAGCHGFPTSLSRERLPDELLGVNAEREVVTMEYDLVHRGIHIFLTRHDSSESTHWWFDWEGKSFWRVGLQTDHEPFSLHERIAWDETPIVLIGGRDGYLRRFDRSFETDDGDNEIESYCLLGPIHLDRHGFNEGILAELTGVTGENSGTVAWEVLAGDSHETATNATARESGTWSRNSLNYTARPRVRGTSAAIKVKNSGKRRWYLERVSALIRSAGKRRVR